ncbi:MAG: tRNA lysidine(34) synthetase TilS, partial [Alphaproteobacteria bacterium]|nr:tRNA lysidine(34) synthetase TilS [Alphaproteobacteria bacterium]
EEVVWDGRFRAAFAGRPDPTARLGALGAEGFRLVAAVQPQIARLAPVARLRAALPALWDERGVSAVPHLRYKRSEEGVTIARLLFRPTRPLTSEAAYLV